MTEQHIKETILALFREKEIMQDIQEDEDFFELGVSSLTIVELQISVEAALDLKVKTSELMSSQTIKEWVGFYTQAAQEQELATS